MLKLLNKCNEGLRYVEYAIISGSVIALAILLCGNIVSRVIVENSWSFTEEVGQILIIIITYIGSAYVARYFRHIRVTFLTDLLPDRFQKGLLMLICFLSALAFFYFAYWDFQYMLTARELGRITVALSIPKWTFQIPIVLGLFGTGVQCLMSVVLNILDKDTVYMGSSREVGESISI